jgi:lactate permease
VNGLWQIGSLGGGLAGLGIVFLLGRFGRKAGVSTAPEPAGKIRAGMAAYGLLVGIILAVRWIEPLRVILGAGVLKASFPEIANGVGMTIPAEDSAAIAPFAHAGALLVYSAAAAYILFSFLKLTRPGAPRRILDRLARSAAPVSLGILFLIGVSTLMSHAGMTAELSEGLIRLVGPAFPAVAPWLGGFGAFLTGSNTNSNLLFAPLQQRVASAIGRPERVLLAAQTGGGAVGSVLSPAKVTVGSGAADGTVREGDVIRRLVLPVALLLLILSLLTVLLPA